MLKDNNICITVSNRNRSYYEKLGYLISINSNVLNIKTIDLPNNSHLIVNVICDRCGKEYSLIYAKYVQNISNYGFFTCKKCSSEKKKLTNLKKFGVDNYAKKEGFGDEVKKIKLEKYGNENYNNIEKYTKTMFEKYGTDHYMKTNDFREKSKQSKKEKYGNENYLNAEKTKKTKLEKYGDPFYVNLEKSKKTNFKRYGVDNYSKTNEFKIKLWKYYNKKLLEKIPNIINIDRKNNLIKIKCEKCDNEVDINLRLVQDRLEIKTEICTICNPINSYSNSGYETQLQNFIKNNYSEEILYNDRKTIGSEIDIYLSKEKLAFEFNGLFWHNEVNVPNNYHLNKTELAEKQGIQLIQIYEDDWIYKQDIVKSRILNLLGKSEKIMARKYEIKEINDNKLIKDFLENNHLQGFVRSKIKIGLFCNNELVSLMIFGYPRKPMSQKSVKGSYEMLRFCNKLNANVFGGATLLFKYFLKKYKPLEIISYDDRSWSSKNLYEKLGFKFVHKTKPDYYYVIRNKRFCKFNFRKNKLVKEGFDPNKTEHEIMLERKIYRIYDTGQLKYIFKTNN